MDIEDILLWKEQGQSYGQIAKVYNVTRQRIQQLLRCPPSVKEFLLKKHQSLCTKCSNNIEPLHIHHKTYNPLLFYELDNLELLCSSCHTKLHRPIINSKQCSYCGHSFHARDLKARTRRNSSGSFFCSKFCQGKYIGRKYGFAAHPEHRGQPPHIRKWDYNEIIKLKNSGLAFKEIFNILRIPQATYYKICKSFKY